MNDDVEAVVETKKDTKDTIVAKGLEDTILKSWEADFGDTVLTFNERYTNDKAYLFSVLATKGVNQMAAHVFVDEININQINCSVGSEENGEAVIELYASLMGGINATVPTYKKTIMKRKERRELAKKIYRENH